jgi:hypothetical protein
MRVASRMRPEGRRGALTVQDQFTGTTRYVAASGDITSALNAAIAASVSGDIIEIGAGACSMSSAVSMISDKNIKIQGAGKGVTVITADSGFGTLETTGANSPTWRLTGFTLTSTLNVGVLLTVYADQHASWRGPFRIDNIEFNYPNNQGGGALAFYGPIYGVMHDVDYIQDTGVAIVTGLGVSGEDGSSTSSLVGAWAASQAYAPGGEQNFYIEDCTFTGGEPSGIAAIDTAYTGGRMVLRHNAFTNATLYAHWTSGGSVNSLWWEVYNNTFTWTLAEELYPMRLQGGGTGVLYNNTITGFAGNYILIGEGRLAGQSSAPLLLLDGTHDWDGNAGDAAADGWPGLCQTGRAAGKTIAAIIGGDKQASFPLYLWNNGPQNKCANSGASGDACDNSFAVATSYPAYFKATPHATSGYGNGDVDYSISSSQPSGAGTHTLTYTPYTYPHPMR